MLSLLFALFFVSFANDSKCKQCHLQNGSPYNCGDRIQIGKCTYVCCDGAWQQCAIPCRRVIGCICRKSQQLSIQNLSMVNYSLTSNNHLQTEYVTTAKLINGVYSLGEIKHSTNLTIGELIVWPGFDIDSAIRLNVILEVEQLDGVNDNSKCTIRGYVSTICHPKTCCGSNCC